MIAWTLTTAFPNSSGAPGDVIAAGSADHLALAAAEACTAAADHFDAHADTPGVAVCITVDGTEVHTGPGYDHTGRYDPTGTHDGLDNLRQELTGQELTGQELTGRDCP